MDILTNAQITELPHWATQLADLTRIAWTGEDGICYFPYLPLTQPEFWQKQILSDWQNNNIFSWVMVEGSEVKAHAALVRKNSNFECGRWVALPDAPKGSMTILVGLLIDFAHKRKWNFWVECTQAHTASQKICERHGLRFAGIGILSQINGIWWDIIYFDTADPAKPFEPQSQILANPLRQQIKMQKEYEVRLTEINSIISTLPGSPLPPKFFHTLPHLEPIVREIIRLNL